MSEATLFAIRTKLGDTLVALASLLAWRARHPDARAGLLLRADYLPLLAGDDSGLDLVPFGSRMEMALRLGMRRLRGEHWDELAVLCGYGRPMRLIARLVRARRRVYLDQRFADLYPEWPEPRPALSLVDPSWDVVRLLDPDCPKPDRLHLPGLAARRRPEPAVGVVALADEARRGLDLASLQELIAAVGERHPGRELRLLLNPADAGARPLLAAALPARLVRFSRIDELVDAVGRLEAWYGTDTGLYHLAVAMGIPATVFFGPTQPGKVTLPGQPGVQRQRLPGLGERHCEVKDCRRPLCLHRAVAAWAGRALPAQAEPLPAGCLLES